VQGDAGNSLVSLPLRVRWQVRKLSVSDKHLSGLTLDRAFMVKNLASSEPDLLPPYRKAAVPCTVASASSSMLRLANHTRPSLTFYANLHKLCERRGVW